MKDDSANQGEKPLSIILNNSLSDSKLAILVVLGDCFEESTNCVLLEHLGSQTSYHPLINHLDLMVKLLTVLVSVPTLGLPFVLQILDHLSGQVAFLSCGTNADKLSLSSNKCLATTVFVPFLGTKLHSPGESL